jgi:hypothetical protein
MYLARASGICALEPTRTTYRSEPSIAGSSALAGLIDLSIGSYRLAAAFRRRYFSTM